MTKVGIIGGSGFLGSHIAKYLTDKGITVTIYDIKPPKISVDAEFVQLDITKDDLAVLLKNDVIIHTAIIQIPLINEKPDIGFKVNYLGTQRVLERVANSNIKGLILSSSWHVYGEQVRGVLSEDYGYNPDKVAERAKLYCFSKIMQEMLVRYYSQMVKDKKFVIFRLGTMLGEGMPEKTAANIFITNGLTGKPLTPYKDSMYRPMFYVNVKDVAEAFYRAVRKITSGEELKYSVFNLFWPKPITILNLAEKVKEIIEKITNGKIIPEIRIVDTGKEQLFTPEDAKNVSGSIDRLKQEFNMELTNPLDVLEELIRSRLESNL